MNNPPLPELKPLPNRDWQEDFSHENGNYQNRCVYCEHGFLGHKRRMICKRCDWMMSTTPTKPFDSISIDVSTGEDDAFLRAFADWPPREFMTHLGQRIALFDGYLNEKRPTQAISEEGVAAVAINLYKAAQDMGGEALISWEEANSGAQEEYRKLAKAAITAWNEYINGEKNGRI